MEDWVIVITFTYPHEAHLAKGLLESSDINVIIKDEFTVQVNNLYSNAIGGVKLLVEASKANEALEILENAGYIEKNNQKDKPELEIFPYKYKSMCPYCKGTDVIRKNMPGYVFALSILVFGFPIPFLKRTYHCYDCTKDWKIGR